MSSFTFILLVLVEGFSLMLNQEVREGRINGI